MSKAIQCCTKCGKLEYGNTGPGDKYICHECSSKKEFAMAGIILLAILIQACGPVNIKPSLQVDAPQAPQTQSVNPNLTAATICDPRKQGTPMGPIDDGTAVVEFVYTCQTKPALSFQVYFDNRDESVKILVNVIGSTQPETDLQGYSACNPEEVYAQIESTLCK